MKNQVLQVLSFLYWAGWNLFMLKPLQATEIDKKGKLTEFPRNEMGSGLHNSLFDYYYEIRVDKNVKRYRIPSES